MGHFGTDEKILTDDTSQVQIGAASYRKNLDRPIVSVWEIIEQFLR